MIEFLTVLFSLLSVVLTTKKNSLCWPIGIIGILGYSYIFYDNRDWSNLILQFIFILQSISGWLLWKNEENSKVTSLEFYELFGIINASVLVFIIFLSINIFFQGNLKDLDALTATLSIFGMFLLSKSKIEAWIFWILADVIYIYFFFLNQLYLSSALYLLFLILATYGYLNWRKIKNQSHY